MQTYVLIYGPPYIISNRTDRIPHQDTKSHNRAATAVLYIDKAKRGAMEDMIYKGSVLRIKKCAFDFLSLEEDLIDDDDDDSWELMGRDLRLKSTFLYCDLNHVISNSRDEHKKTLTDLGNRLFYFMEELDQAVKSRSISLIQIRYNDAAHVLQEVIMSLH